MSPRCDLIIFKIEPWIFPGYFHMGIFNDFSE